MTETARAAEIDPAGMELTLTWDDGSTGRFNRFWLRDNCPADGERESLFRSFSVDEMADDLTIIRADLRPANTAVEVHFSDGTADTFDADWLRQRLSRPSETVAGAGVETWHGDHVMSSVAMSDLVPDSETHGALLDELARSGAAVVSGVDGEDGTETLADLLGHIRETDFGRVFDIIVEPDPFTPSQSPTALDPHTDDPYRYTPSGMSILHCVVPSSGDGGASTMVDGFAVAEAIRTTDPDAFRLLSEIAIPFVHRRPESVEQGDAVHLRADATIIAVDQAGRMSGIRFHERSMAPLQLDPDIVDDYYRALIRFTRAIRDERFTWTHKLAAGEAIVYDNQRVLHGRTGFEGSQSRRHLRLCTIDRDQVHSTLRRLRESHNTGTHLARLPAGNLS